MKILKICILFFIITSVIYSQNITNTLGAGGVFYIKDASTNFFTLTQSSGLLSLNNNLSLLNTTGSSVGVINKGAEGFIHNFAPLGAEGNNTFVGINSGNFTISFSSGLDASNNTGMGVYTLGSLTTGYRNTAVGTYSLSSSTTARYNVAFGSYSLRTNTEGNYNTASGCYSLYTNSIGIYNTTSGYQSLFSNSIGSYNTAVGFYSLYGSIGSFNTALGSGSGSGITSGSNLTCLGSNAQPSASNATNEITLGDGNVTSLRCAVITITSLSDARDKKNIKDLNLGIDFLMKIKPRLFYWDKREWYDNNISDGSKMLKKPTAGFIAQELDEVQTTTNSEWLKLVLKDSPQRLEATPGNMLPIMVKAIQDLKKENEVLNADNNKLITTITELKDKLIKIEQIQNMLATKIEKLNTNRDETAKVSLGEK